MQHIHKIRFFLLGALIGALIGIPIISAQNNTGLRREAGTIYTKGTFAEFTAGANITAGNALYLDSTGKVQPLTSAQANNAIGVAYDTVLSGATAKVQNTGIVTVTCDGNVAINDLVGGTSLAVAGAVKTLTNTLAATASGAVITTLTGKVTANGTGGATVVLGTSSPTAPVITLDSSAITQPTISITGSGATSRILGRALTACTDTGTFKLLLR
jgi:hypothetical protein